MRYLLDANVLITADRDYYPLERVPEFWDWLLHQGSEGRISVPFEIFDEVIAGKGDLVEWAKAHKDTLVVDSDAELSLVKQVLSQGYAPDLTEDEVEKVGKDPFLVACALSSKSDTTVVTTEISRPTKKRANRKLPDVCKEFGVRCISTFGLVRELNFSTDWRSA